MVVFKIDMVTATVRPLSDVAIDAGRAVKKIETFDENECWRHGREPASRGWRFGLHVKHTLNKRKRIKDHEELRMDVGCGGGGIDWCRG